MSVSGVPCVAVAHLTVAGVLSNPGGRHRGQAHRAERQTEDVGIHPASAAAADLTMQKRVAHVATRATLSTPSRRMRFILALGMKGTGLGLEAAGHHCKALSHRHLADVVSGVGQRRCAGGGRPFDGLVRSA
jgi:hypothetical protein